MKRYPAYRDSGVEWLGEVPDGWDILNLKHVCYVFPSNVDKHSHPGEIPVQLCNYTDVYYNDRITSSLDFMSATATEAEIEKFTLRVGDVIFTKDSETADDIGIAAIVAEELPGVVCGYHLSIARPNFDVEGRFIKAFFDSAAAKAHFEVTANGLTRVGLGQYAINNLQLAVPPLPEQRAIADFLDRETAKIDALVEEQRRLIALLAEKRQAVISHAVTKGLNPNAPLKPSGFDWLGDIPEGWEAGPLKRRWSVTDCKHVTAEFVDDGYPLASIREVQSRWVNLAAAKQTSSEYYEQLIEAGRKPRAGDLIFSRNATVGEVAQVHADHPLFAMGQDVCLIRRPSDAISSDFMQAFLMSIITQKQLDVLMIGSTFKRVNVEAIRNLTVVFPPVSEQHLIAQFVEQEAAQFDALTEAATSAIALLQERRAALISAAVTGKIDLRDEAARNQEPA